MSFGLNDTDKKLRSFRKSIEPICSKDSRSHTVILNSGTPLTTISFFPSREITNLIIYRVEISKKIQLIKLKNLFYLIILLGILAIGFLLGY